MLEFIPVLGRNDIEQMVTDVAHRISSEYQNKELILIGILKGAFVFLSDLVRKLTIPFKIDFVCVSSYGFNTLSSGNISLNKEIDIDINNKNILIIEDIVDTGSTLSYLVKYLKSFNPGTIKVCTLLDKYECRKENVKIDYACHVVSEGFFVGYGLIMPKIIGTYRIFTN